MIKFTDVHVCFVCARVCSVSWTDCGAPHGKIMMTAFLEETRYAKAREQCQNLNGDLATVQSTLERNCANAALNKVRTCTCCNSRVFYQCARVSGTELCSCSAWVGLTGTNFSNGKFQSWTWYTPSSNTRSGSIAWINGFPLKFSDWYRGFYRPELGGFGNAFDFSHPYLCQQYYPPGELTTLEMKYRSYMHLPFCTGCAMQANCQCCKKIINYRS